MAWNYINAESDYYLAFFSGNEWVEEPIIAWRLSEIPNSNYSIEITPITLRGAAIINDYVIRCPDGRYHVPCTSFGVRLAAEALDYLKGKGK